MWGFKSPLAHNGVIDKTDGSASTKPENGGRYRGLWDHHGPLDTAQLTFTGTITVPEPVTNTGEPFEDALNRVAVATEGDRGSGRDGWRWTLVGCRCDRHCLGLPVRQ